MTANAQACLDISDAPTVALHREGAPRLWMPDRVLFTPDALALAWGEQIHSRVRALGLPVEVLRSNRVVGLRGSTDRDTYRLAKRTLSVVVAPASQLRLEPIPPSADWQFHLAQGCPAHCQYCYLAGSLQGPPTVRVYANLPEILANLARYVRPDRTTTFEASCYTDPLALEHLTGSLGRAIAHFGTDAMQGAQLRWVTKFASVEPLAGLAHNGRTRCRFSINAEPMARRFEGGTDPVSARLTAAATLAGCGYPIGLVLAPIIATDGWREHYDRLLDQARATLPASCDLTFELITHRFTPSSKETLRSWYPNSALDMDESVRAAKRNKFGSRKYVYRSDTMHELRGWFERAIAARFEQAQVLYWT